MSNYRKFWLINSQNERYDFTLKEQKTFLSDPSGLGFSKTLDTVKLGYSAIIVDSDLDLPSVTGNLLFYDSTEKAYADYDDFMDFIKYTPLKLHYQPANLLTSFYIDCIITSLQKGEYDNGGKYLECPITFSGLSRWTNSSQNTLVVTNGESSNGKYYDLKRPYNYSANSLTDISITVNGQLPIGFVFEIVGEVTNPLLQITQDEEQYGIIKIDGNFTYLKVDSRDDSEDIYLEKDEIPITNPIIYQDPTVADGKSEVTFVKLKVGVNRISFTCDDVDNFDGYIRFMWKDSRLSV